MKPPTPLSVTFLLCALLIPHLSHAAVGQLFRSSYAPRREADLATASTDGTLQTEDPVTAPDAPANATLTAEARHTTALVWEAALGLATAVTLVGLGWTVKRCMAKRGDADAPNKATSMETFRSPRGSILYELDKLEAEGGAAACPAGDDDHLHRMTPPEPHTATSTLQRALDLNKEGA